MERKVREGESERERTEVSEDSRGLVSCVSLLVWFVCVRLSADYAVLQSC